MTTIRKLTADEIEVRIQSIVKDRGSILLLYKTARVDRAILNETFGELWQNDFKVIDGKMYGGIGIYNKELKEWIWRWDCGSESNTEAEKGQASDCFKRAGFKWGIGVELYTAPFIWVKSTDKNEKYDVKHIAYNHDGISELVITDKKGNTVYTLHAKAPAKQERQAPASQKETPAPAQTLKERLDACIKFLSAQPDKSLNIADEKSQTIISRTQDILNELQTAGRAAEYKQLNDLCNTKLLKAA